MILKGNLVARRGRVRFGFWDRIQNFTIFLPSLYSEHTGTIQMLSCTPCAPFGAEPPIVECHQSVTRSSQAAAANSLYLELTCKYSKAFYGIAIFAVLMILSKLRGKCGKLSAKKNVILHSSVKAENPSSFLRSRPSVKSVRQTWKAKSFQRISARSIFNQLSGPSF